MNASEAVRRDDWAQFPQIAAALDMIDGASDAASLSAAREALRKAELQRDIALGFQDLWADFDWQQARAFGLIGGSA